jgi:adenine-specific DNA-methyltransferase
VARAEESTTDSIDVSETADQPDTESEEDQPLFTDVSKAELVWPGKYEADGRRKEVPRVSLPFQVIETINESRATRVARAEAQPTLFDVWEAKEGETFEEGWRNKLIWGDNLLVTGSLLAKFAGKVNLIYVDPPFLTGADFSFRTSIGDEHVTKEASLIEEKAYRDTWGGGRGTFIDMLHQRFQLMRDLLAPEGVLFVHMGWEVTHYVKLALDDVFGVDHFVNQIIWKRQTAHSDIGQGAKHLGPIHDVILLYSKGESYPWNMQYTPYTEEFASSFYRHVESETGRRYGLSDITGPGGAAKGNPRYEFLGVTRYWRFSEKRMKQMYEDGRIVQTKPGAVPRQKRYLDDMPGIPLQDLWLDIPMVQAQSKERLGYDTQKPEKLLERVLELNSKPGDLVADFFVGSGTTCAVAEKLDRRWIGCDLSRWAIHVSRKRLLAIEDCRPFEVLNLGKYERKQWQVATFGEDLDQDGQIAFYEYLAFILKLYGGEPLSGSQHLHGRRGSAVIHIGAVDAPVTIDEITNAIQECVAMKQSELHVLGWEWEMGLAGPDEGERPGGLMHEEARKKGVKLVLRQIPREVMEEQAVDRGDIHFFELAYLEVGIERTKPRGITVTLKDFVIPNTELVPEEVRNKITEWSDYVDYWAVDWDFRSDTFMQGWVDYRTRQDRSLKLTTDLHQYDQPGSYRVVVKVVDIFGNDSSQAYDVEVV